MTADARDAPLSEAAIEALKLHPRPHSVVSWRAKGGNAIVQFELPLDDVHAIDRCLSDLVAARRNLETRLAIERRISNEFNTGLRLRCSMCERLFLKDEAGSYGSYCALCHAPIVQADLLAARRREQRVRDWANGPIAPLIEGASYRTAKRCTETVLAILDAPADQERS